MTSQTPSPTTPQPISDEKNLLTIVESGGSCCGGSCCASD